MGFSSGDFLRSSNKAVAKELRTAPWYVMEQYEFRSGKGGRYIQAPTRYIDAEGRPNLERWEYQPLVSYPDLFLRFARLADDGRLDGGGELNAPYVYSTDKKLEDMGVALDTDKNAEAALDWAQTYGVLGLSLRKGGLHSWWANENGGEGDSVAAFALEAWAANRALRLYQAAMAPTGMDVETITSLIPDPTHKETAARWPGLAREMALIDAKGELTVRQHYFHQIVYWEFGEGLPRYRTGHTTRGVGFTNLLGAMWLQMFWLLTSGDVRWCKYPRCNNVIAYEQPEQTVDPGPKKNDRSRGYKTRVDKEYCRDLCRNRHWRMKQKQQR